MAFEYNHWYKFSPGTMPEEILNLTQLDKKHDWHITDEIILRMHWNVGQLWGEYLPNQRIKHGGRWHWFVPIRSNPLFWMIPERIKEEVTPEHFHSATCDEVTPSDYKRYKEKLMKLEL